MSCLRVAATLVVVMATTAPVLAQGRITGVVRDVAGRPIKGAVVRAFNEDATPRERTSTTDDRGRWVMLGLRVAPNWTFVAEAPGYFPEQGTAAVRTTLGAPIVFVLRSDPGPLPGALSRNIAEQLSDAARLRDEGRYDEAIAAYLAVRKNNEKLTSVGLVLAGVYRLKASSETETQVRRSLLERAAAAYNDVLAADADNERARTEMTAVQLALSELR
jgi:hypothetical protein